MHTQLFSRHGRNRHSSLTGSPTDSPRFASRSFYNGAWRGDSATALVATARQANTAGAASGGAAAATSATNSNASLASETSVDPKMLRGVVADNGHVAAGRPTPAFHYYTQPVDASVLAAAAAAAASSASSSAAGASARGAKRNETPVNTRANDRASQPICRLIGAFAATISRAGVGVQLAQQPDTRRRSSTSIRVGSFLVE